MQIMSVWYDLCEKSNPEAYPRREKSHFRRRPGSAQRQLLDALARHDPQEQQQQLAKQLASLREDLLGAPGPTGGTPAPPPASFLIMSHWLNLRVPPGATCAWRTCNSP